MEEIKGDDFDIDMSKYKSKRISYNSEQDRIYEIKDVMITPERCSGNTSRQIDLAIQLLFDGKTIRVEDHDGLEISSKYLIRKIIKRLENEYYMGQPSWKYELCEVEPFVIKLRKIEKTLNSETWKVQ